MLVLSLFFLPPFPFISSSNHITLSFLPLLPSSSSLSPFSISFLFSIHLSFPPPLHSSSLLLFNHFISHSSLHTFTHSSSPTPPFLPSFAFHSFLSPLPSAFLLHSFPPLRSFLFIHLQLLFSHTLARIHQHTPPS